MITDKHVEPGGQVVGISQHRGVAQFPPDGPRLQNRCQASLHLVQIGIQTGQARQGKCHLLFQAQLAGNHQGLLSIGQRL